MKVQPNVFIRLYCRVLRLYPAAFQAAFADEMLEVFTRGLEAARQQGRFVSVWFVLREFATLPLEMLREHRAGRPTASVLAAEQSPLAFFGQQVFTYRRCNLSALVLVTGFALLVVLPFFALGLHHEPAVSVAGGAYDPKGYAFFQTDLGGWSRIAGMLAALLGRVLLPLLSIRLAYTLLRHGRRWAQRRQRWAVISLLVISAACAFMYSPLGRTIVSWYFD